MNWIDTKKKLPDKEGTYLVIAESRDGKEIKMQVLKYYNTKGSYNYNGSMRWSHDGKVNPSKVLMWSELPPSPITLGLK